MDRITVLCCTNMSGTDKRKLLIIGKSARPRCFKGLRMEGLPVEYHANKNAWMTYFMQEGNEGSPTSALNTCADFVEVKSYKNKRQTTLDAFLHCM